MYRIMYKVYGSEKEQCMGSSTDSEHALEEMDRLEKGPLGKKGSFKMIREGTMKEKEEKRCEECKATCSGAGKEGNGNQCSFHTTEEEEVYKW